MKKFFYKNWALYYILFFLLIGLLIYALLWRPINNCENQINDINKKLEDCKNRSCDSIRTINPDTTKVIRDTTQVDTVKVDKTINCNATAKSGGQGITKTRHELGNRSGNVYIECNMLGQPDEINVFYDNKLVASSNGPVSYNNSLQFYYNAISGKPTYCIVKIIGKDSGTHWEYTLNCPQ